MIIIFGTKGRITKSDENDILEKACPGCGEDLVLSDLKKWFTLFFIPIFPFSTVDTFFHCKNCDASYKKDVKAAILGSKKDQEKIKKEAEKMFATTLAACMTHMAKIDGKISKEENEELKKLSKELPDFKNEIEKTIDQVKSSKDEELVFSMLRNSSKILTSSGLSLIFNRIAKVLLADGKIDKKEEELLKEYMLICGIPRDLYSTIIKKK